MVRDNRDCKGWLDEDYMGWFGILEETWHKCKVLVNLKQSIIAK